MASFYTVTQRSCLKTLGSWVVHESNICASEGSNGVCFGDVGGPLIHPRASSQGYAQIGIISTILSPSCVTKGVPQIFTDVAKFTSWIDETICKFSKSKPKSCSKA
jgi:secreted trypsin-like serine protease